MINTTSLLSSSKNLIIELEWLHLNALLYGLNGIHTVRGGQSWAGSFTEEELRKELTRSGNVLLRYVLDLVHRVPNPMKNTWYAWERSSIRISPVEEGWEEHASTVAA